ncbi:yrdC domain-containing protein, mitochondrial [Venturia canescens]|uniref:yrdC domain-containing protein, mitochondrial n=1 Tax=Venturia canescens TaxID=32260 RepID=UPI001C9C34B3|nr:yrdC domain-containing protein, mitochondrial [Venturia canescens]
MLQSSMFTQLARVKFVCRIMSIFDVQANFKQTSTQMSNYVNPMAFYQKKAREMVSLLEPEEKHWFAGGPRSNAVALNCLYNEKVIAVPTDTIYGFAALAQNNKAINKLYEIKGREKTKPLAVTVSCVHEITQWAETDHLTPRLLRDLLPGPVTVVLKRKASLNPAFNPGHETVGIRVPRSKFIQSICTTIGQPLALTSANISNEQSSLHPNEFAPLWPKLGAIFYELQKPSMLDDAQRVGSTVVDLTVPGEYEILRKGIHYARTIRILNEFGVDRNKIIVTNAEELPSECSECINIK